ncbi:MAG: amidase [Alphaproteobacteria bacterium]|nr:MAG: amidase [Alphaproteobacteria bacterium]
MAENEDPTRRDALHTAAGAAGAVALATAAPIAAMASSGGTPDLSAGARDYLKHDATGLAAIVRRREATPEELLAAAIEIAERVNPAINALSQQFEERAHKATETGLPPGPLHGVPYLLKDLALMMGGTVTTQGSRYFRDFTAPADDTFVARLKAAGLNIFGKTTTPEFGLTVTTESALTGITRNPWNLERSSGGSSGGAAAAVAAGIVPAAQGSDGGGSIRIPAACCGLFGLKPSRGRTPVGPFRGEGWAGLSVVHALTRSVRDSALLLDLVSAPEPGARLAAPPPPRSYVEAAGRDPERPLRIALLAAHPLGGELHPDCHAAVEEAAKLCTELGHHVEPAFPTLDIEVLNRAIVAIIAIETSLLISAREQATGVPPSPGVLEEVTLAYHELGRTMDPRAYPQALYDIQTQAYRMGRFLESHDVILSPTLARPPIGFGTVSLDQPFEKYRAAVAAYSPFTAIYNMTGQPAMNVPLYWNAQGLPIGTMFAARYGEEHTLFSLAGQLERARPWAGRHPPVWPG